MCALFIKSDIQYNCNICSDSIDKDKIIGLKCDPSKHIFCYDCIFDWYKILKKKHGSQHYPMMNMCPICRKNGGLLPIIEGIDPVKSIHNFKMLKNKIPQKQLINPNKLEHECGLKLLTTNGYCKLIGKYDGLCGKHSSKKDLVIQTSNEKSVNPNKLEGHCGMKLKTKNGFCTKKSSDLYGGFCFLHSNVQNNNNNNNNNIIVV